MWNFAHVLPHLYVSLGSVFWKMAYRGNVELYLTGFSIDLFSKHLQLIKYSELENLLLSSLAIILLLIDDLG